MKTKLQRLADERSLLVSDAALQRMTLSGLTASLERPVRVADRAIDIVRSLISKPVLVSGAIALLAGFGKKKGLSRWPRRLWTGWQIFRTLDKMRPRRQTSAPQSGIPSTNYESFALPQ